MKYKITKGQEGSLMKLRFLTINLRSGLGRTVGLSMDLTQIRLITPRDLGSGYTCFNTTRQIGSDSGHAFSNQDTKFVSFDF